MGPRPKAEDDTSEAVHRRRLIVPRTRSSSPRISHPGPDRAHHRAIPLTIVILGLACPRVGGGPEDPFLRWVLSFAAARRTSHLARPGSTGNVCARCAMGPRPKAEDDTSEAVHRRRLIVPRTCSSSPRISHPGPDRAHHRAIPLTIVILGLACPRVGGGPEDPFVVW